MFELIPLQNSSAEVENLNEQFKIQPMNSGGDRAPYPTHSSNLVPGFLPYSSSRRKSRSGPWEQGCTLVLYLKKRSYK